MVAVLIELAGNEMWVSDTDMVVDQWGPAADANVVDAVNVLDKSAGCGVKKWVVAAIPRGKHHFSSDQ